MYNDSMYNDTEYNLTQFAHILSETITLTDALNRGIGLTLTESQATADVISDGVSMTALLETINILQRARTAFMYNGGCYNWYMYNSRLDEDEILLMVTKVLSDTITLSDVITASETIKILIETITLSDSVSSSFALAALIEFVFIFDSVQVQISNKALNDTIRLNDWLSIKFTPYLEYWSN